jgi:iduronate 2-sulfatase
MYPTLLELSGRAIPDHMEGTSLVPLLKDPQLEWKSAVFSQFPRGNPPGIEGFAIRTSRYRYVEWRSYVKGNNGKVIGQELYDHQADPHESVNIASAHPDIVKKLAARLKDGWKAALPPSVAKATAPAPAPEKVSSDQ